ncbi:hypothetical protein HaLaN_26600 [Haematococcus lacustris]|uniref:Uncharacterized protein n=1 Tax=Haematococcus lacustris TaxID=44745 RepID=A0A6A0A6L8_HAELA|nr:hypothetical protein HaLaN_26600 [Haematococcus lacustris]
MCVGGRILADRTLPLVGPLARHAVKQYAAEGASQLEAPVRQVLPEGLHQVGYFSRISIRSHSQTGSSSASEIPRDTFFFGNAGIATRGGWRAKAVLQVCREVVERANSGKPTDRVPSKVVTVDEFRNSRVSSIMNSPSPVRRSWTAASPPGLKAGSPSQVRCRTAYCSQPGASGHPWGPWQMGGQGLQRSPQHPAGRGEQVALARAVQVATPSKASCQGQGVPRIGLQEAARPSTQGPSPAACSTVACVP